MGSWDKRCPNKSKRDVIVIETVLTPALERLGGHFYLVRNSRMGDGVGRMKVYGNGLRPREILIRT